MSGSCRSLTWTLLQSLYQMMSFHFYVRYASFLRISALCRTLNRHGQLVLRVGTDRPADLGVSSRVGGSVTAQPVARETAPSLKSPAGGMYDGAYQRLARVGTSLAVRR